VKVGDDFVAYLKQAQQATQKTGSREENFLLAHYVDTHGGSREQGLKDIQQQEEEWARHSTVGSVLPHHYGAYMEQMHAAADLARKQEARRKKMTYAKIPAKHSNAQWIGGKAAEACVKRGFAKLKLVEACALQGGHHRGVGAEDPRITGHGHEGHRTGVGDQRIGGVGMWWGPGAECARAEFEMALLKDPHNAAAHCGLGDILRMRAFSGDPSCLAAAAAEYGKAVELEPTNSEFHVRLRQALPENYRAPAPIEVRADLRSQPEPEPQLTKSFPGVKTTGYTPRNGTYKTYLYERSGWEC